MKFGLLSILCLLIASLFFVSMSFRFLGGSSQEMNMEQSLEAPHWKAPFGTDQFGRSVFKRVIEGSSFSLGVALSSSFLALVVGLSLALLGRLWRGLDQGLSRVSDLFLSVPDILLALVLMAILGAGLTNLILVLSLIYMPLFFRIARSSLMQVEAEEYFTAAQVIGASWFRKIKNYWLPNIARPLVAQWSLCASFALLSESALSFIGFGVEPGTASWGLMLAESRDWLSLAWWPSLFPGLILTLSVLAFQFIGYEWESKIGKV